MKKNTIATGLLTVMALSTFTIGAFAAEPTAPNAAGLDKAAVTVTLSHGKVKGMKMPDLKTGEDGGRYVELEDGSRVYISVTGGSSDALDSVKAEMCHVTAQGAPAGMKAPELQTDGDGNQFFLTEDGQKIYFEKKQLDSADVQFNIAAEGEGAKFELKTDENGQQYADLEDGSRVYVSLANSALVD